MINSNPPSALAAVQSTLTHAKAAGFEWPNLAAVLAKLEEEVAEFREALAGDNPAHAAEELGDIMFVCVDLALKLGEDAEGILSAANKKFIHRFKIMETLAAENSFVFKALSGEAKRSLWGQAKEIEKAQKNA